MTRHEPILQTIELNPEYASADWDYNDHLGYVSLQPEPAGENVRLLGFGALRSPNGGFDLSDEAISIVDFSQLHSSAQSIDLQGKGVGPRLYNTPWAAAGLTDAPSRQGAYLVDIDLAKVFDTRNTQGNKFQRIRRHAGRIVRSKLEGEERVVSEIHESFGDAEAVLYTQPPRAELREQHRSHRSRNGSNSADIASEFILIRSITVPIHKIGEFEQHRFS